MKFYDIMYRLKIPGSYVGRIFTICFVGVHIPLISFILVVVGEGRLFADLGYVAVLVLATVVGTSLTCIGIFAILAPVRSATLALEAYSESRQLPELPTRYLDLAGRLMTRVQATILALDGRIATLEGLSSTDPLTSLFNRRWLSEEGEATIEKAQAGGKLLSLLVIDVDRFKQLNDRHGHTTGDKVLILVADAIRAGIRSSDYGVRLGGDEFCVLMEGADKATAAEAGQRIREAVRQSAKLLLGVEPVSLSLGVATLHPDDAGFHDMFLRADGNLYRAKAAGRNRLVAG